MAAARRLHAVPDPDDDGPTGERPTAHGRDHERLAAMDELMRGVARGSVIAFEQLYAQVSPAVYGIALRVTRDAHLAEDVAQEALVEVWRTAPRFAEERGSARAWILTIAHRRAVDRVRSEQAHTDRLRVHGAAHVDTGPDLASADAAVDKVYAEWEAARVAAGLNRLTAVQREALELAYYKGLTHREVAQELNVPLGTAKTRLRDAMLSLKNAWEVER